MKLFFDPVEHKYTDELNNPYISVTTLLNNYVPEFDRAKWLAHGSKDLGISQKELGERWDNITKESQERGTAQHEVLEDSIKNYSMFAKAVRYLKDIDGGRMITIQDIAELSEVVEPLDMELFMASTDYRYPAIYENFQKLIDIGYKIYSEIGVFLQDALISGCIDVPCISETGFAILDWKTNKDGIKKESGYFRKDKSEQPYQLTNEWVTKHETMKPPVNNLPDCNFYHYALQLSLYAYMTEMTLHLPCNGIRLCHIQAPFILNKYGMPYRDINGMYTIDATKEETVSWHPVPYLRNEVIAIVNDRKLKIANTISRQFAMFPQ
jgi:hypothetical protein